MDSCVVHGDCAGLCVQKCGNYYNLIVCNADHGRVDPFTLEGCFYGDLQQ